MFSQFFFALAAIAAFSLADGMAASADGAAPLQADTILTVTGTSNTTANGDLYHFDREALMKLGLTTLKTTTIWTEGIQTFEGVSLSAFAAALGVKTGTFRATAINDYTVEIPVSDAIQGGPIIAFKLNGDAMSVREKGPLWIVYPYDASAEYRTEVIYSRSIWQLDRIEVVE
ncbi:MAG: oxidoreductase [Sulfitobacter sp.]